MTFVVNLWYGIYEVLLLLIIISVEKLSVKKIRNNFLGDLINLYFFERFCLPFVHVLHLRWQRIHLFSYSLHPIFLWQIFLLPLSCYRSVSKAPGKVMVMTVSLQVWFHLIRKEFTKFTQLCYGGWKFCFAALFYWSFVRFFSNGESPLLFKRYLLVITVVMNQ